MTDTVQDRETHTHTHTHNDNDTDTTGYIHELVAETAHRRPTATAVVQGEAAVTYGELNDGADRLARRLAELGSGPDARVGVCLERSIESILVQLAIFKTGAAAVLLDPEYPRERLAFMLADSAAIAVVTRAEQLTSVDGGPPVVRVDEPSWRSAEPIEPGGRVGDQTVCHIAYTSGSTGKPKAVLLRHGAMRNTGVVLRDLCGIDEDSRGSWLCSPGFGLVEVDAFPILAAGGTLHIPDPAVASSPAELQDWLVDTEITQSLVLTAMAERLWGLDWPNETPLRVMRIAGERVRTWPPEHLPFRVLNVYGSAEATVVATIDLGEAGRALGAKRRAELMPPVGKAVANVRMYVLNPDLEPVAPWETGELYVSGASLSEGYLNRPDANAGKFLPNPIADDPYPVLYRSGDVARTWADGTVEIVGRTDDQVKIRGFLVHLGEVESGLAAQPGVRQCAVLAREDVPGERRLIAYVEASPQEPPSVPALRRAMVESLPRHMVPAVFVVGDLPTTVNGKIDRAKLPPPPRSRPQSDVPYLAPRTEVERALAEIWAEVLEIDDIGVHDTFFELGGDSLRATRLLAEVVAAIKAGRLGPVRVGDTELGLGELFRTPTVAGVADRVAARPGGAGEPTPTTLVPDPTGRYEPFPLTPGQRARRHAGGRLLEWDRDRLDVEEAGAAWNTLVARHDALRTVLRADGTQLAGPPTDEEHMRVTDLREMSADEADRQAAAIRDRLLAASAPEPGEPLHEFRLVLLPEQAVRVLLWIHPVVADAHSVHHVLLPELSELYEDPDTILPELALTFRDFVLHADSGPDPTPPAHPAAPPTTPTEHHTHAYEVWQWTALTQAAAAAATTPGEAVLTALAGTVAAHGGFVLHDVEPLRPRPHADLDAVVGNLTPAPDASPEGPPVLAVTNLLDHRPVGRSTAFGRESRGVFREPGVAAHLLIRVVEGRLLLDWDLCPDHPSLTGLPPGAAHRLTTACETAVAQLTAMTHQEETGERA